MQDEVECSLVPVGRIGAPYGVAGWNHLQSYTDPVENILGYQKWYIQQKGTWAEIQIAAGRKHGSGLVLQLAGVSDRDKAALYTNCELAVVRATMASLPGDQYYWCDLEGMTVETLSGECLGQLSYLYENTGLDVMVVVNSETGAEQHIPFILGDTVEKVDFSARLVTVDWAFVVKS